MKRLILMFGVTVLLVGGVLATTGVLHVRNTEDETSVILDKKDLGEKAQEVLHQAKDTGSTILERTGEVLRNAGEDIGKPSPDTSAPKKTESPADTDTQEPATEAGKDAADIEGVGP